MGEKGEGAFSCIRRTSCMQMAKCLSLLGDVQGSDKQTHIGSGYTRSHARCMTELTHFPMTTCTCMCAGSFLGGLHMGSEDWEIDPHTKILIYPSGCTLRDQRGSNLFLPSWPSAEWVLHTALPYGKLGCQGRRWGKCRKSQLCWLPARTGTLLGGSIKRGVD